MENHPPEEVFYYSKSAIKPLFINLSVNGGMLLFFIISAIVSFYYQKSFLFFTTGTTLYQTGFFVILLVGILCINLFIFYFIEYKKLKDDAPQLKFSIEGFYSKEFGFFTWGDIIIINVVFLNSTSTYGHYLSFSTKADKSYSVRIEQIDGYEKIEGLLEKYKLANNIGPVPFEWDTKKIPLFIFAILKVISLAVGFIIFLFLILALFVYLKT